MQIRLRNFTSALLVAGITQTMALPAMAQVKPQDLMEHIKTNTTSDYMLTRCGGYFKALMMTNANAEGRLMEQAEATILWFFEQTLALRGMNAEDDMNEVGIGIAGDIDKHARFYLDRMVVNIETTGQPSDDLIAVDQNVCMVMATQRPKSP